MKTLKTITALSFLLALCCLTGCEKNTPSASCYKATVVGFDCVYIVKVEGGNIGETWRGIQHCVTVSNLPSEAKQIGGMLYFTSYGPGSGPFCTADKSYDYPRTTIELLNYSKTDCSQP